MQIIFARHGESLANRLHVFSNRGLEYPLTPAGRQQALELAGRLQGRGITRIYASPVLRALETAILVADRLGVEYEPAPDLREFDVGDLEGRSDAAAWQQWQTVFDAWCRDECDHPPVPGGESCADLRARLARFVDGLLEKHSDPGGNLLCIAHGGLYRVAFPALFANLSSDFITRQSGLRHAVPVVAEVRAGRLVCVEWDGQPVVDSLSNKQAVRHSFKGNP